MFGCVDVDLSGEHPWRDVQHSMGSKGLEASGESRGGVLRFGNHGSLLKWGLGTEEAESAVVKGGVGS